MPLIMPNEQLPIMPVIVMIVGTPFSFKTSLAMTAKNPIHLDGDRGAQRAVGRCPVFVIDNWAEVKTARQNGVFNGKSTMIFDTPKAIIDDFIWNWCQSIKYQANNLKVFGDVGTEFKSFTAETRQSGMDIVIVSHERTKEQGEKTIYEPDITGQSKQLLLRMCDQVGFMEKREVKDPKTNKTIVQTVLTFNPTPQWPFCKNVANLPDMVLPHYTAPEWKSFLDREVIQPAKEAMARMTDEQRSALEFIESWQAAIDAIVLEEGAAEAVTSKELLETYNGEAGITKIAEDHLKKQVAAYFKAHLKKIGFKWVDADKAFKAIVAEDAAAPVVVATVEEKAPETKGEPPVVQKEAVQSESNPGALVKKPKEIEQINGTIGSVNTTDLFAPRSDHAQDAFEQSQAEMDNELFADQAE